MLRVRVIPRRFFLQSFVACKSTSASESIQTEFAPNNSDVTDSFRGTAFAASKRGCFFQEAPRLQNQFSGNLFLQSYLKRILPNEVELLFIFWIWSALSMQEYLFKLILYLNSCHSEILTTKMKYDDHCWTGKTYRSVFVYET